MTPRETQNRTHKNTSLALNACHYRFSDDRYHAPHFESGKTNLTQLAVRRDVGCCGERGLCNVDQMRARRVFQIEARKGCAPRAVLVSARLKQMQHRADQQDRRDDGDQDQHSSAGSLDPHHGVLFSSALHGAVS